MLRFSVMFNEFCRDHRNDIDHDKYFSDLRKQSTVDLFFNKASILHSNLFRMTYEALKHHGFDRPRRPPPNSRYLRKVAWLVYPGNEFKAESDFFIALITQNHSNNPGALSSVAASTQQAGPFSVGITWLGTLSYKSSFTLSSALPTATVQAQASSAPTTSTLSVSSQYLFQNKALNQYNEAIRQLMDAYFQWQLTNPTMAGALRVPPMVPAAPAPPISFSGSASRFGILTMPQSHPVPPIVPSSIPNMFHHSKVRIISLLLRNSYLLIHMQTIIAEVH